MANSDRPLSPFFIYRPQITSVLSILHRITGVVLSVGAPVLVYWLVAAASGEPAYERAMDLLSTPPALVLLGGWSFAFFYHLFNGIRHLFWDVGYGFEIKEVIVTGWAVVVAAFACTALFWTLVLGGSGGNS